MKNKILAAIGFFGFLLLISSVEGLEQNTISIAQCLIQFVSGLLMMFLSGRFAGAMNYRDDEKITYGRKIQISKRQLRNRSKHVA